MSTDIALAADAGLNALINMSDASNPFAKAADEAGAMANHYLRFSGNTGEWSRTGDTIEEGTVFAMMIYEAKVGFIGWKNQKPVSEYLTLIRTSAKQFQEKELPDLGPKEKETDGYAKVIRFPVRDLQGGPQMDLTDKADLGWRPIWKLVQAFGAEARMHIDKATGIPKIPLVEIGSEPMDTKFGKKYRPTYKITGWMSEAELAELIGEEGVDVDPDAQDAAQDAALAAVEAAAKVAPAVKAAAPRTVPGRRV